MAYNLMFVLPMVWLDFIAPHTGLALATTLSAIQQSWMLYRALKSKSLYSLDPIVTSLFLRSLPALILMAVVLLVLKDIDWHTLEASSRVLRLTGIIAAAASTYGITLLLLGVRPNDFKSP